MSLNGSIEDLPLLEILQVVSFCQKTGHLTVHAREGDAGVVFREGRVVSGYIWDTPLPSLSPPGSSGRDKQVRQRIASILERLVRLHDGHFAFNLTDDVPTRFGGRDLSDETLADGINPEELMLDLARKLDEDRRDGAAALEATFSAPAADEEPLPEVASDETPTPPRKPPILLVDDEPEVCRIVGRQLADSGFEVTVAASAGHARREMARLSSDGRRFLLVVDLGLPSTSGSVFRGGFDVARDASGLASPPPVLLMVESFDGKLRARAKRLGVSLVAFKPGLSKLDPRQYEADLKAFADKLARDLLPRLAGRRGAAAAAASRPARETGDAADRAAALRSALKEIEAEPDVDLVSLQLLRAARSFFARAILFVVKDDQLRGVSGFGPTGGERLDLLARGLTMPLDVASPFADAVASGRAWCDAVPAEGPVDLLLELIGRLEVRQAAIVPIQAWRATIAVLYADAPSGERLPVIDGFLAFVDEATRTLEAALLARRTERTVA